MDWNKGALLLAQCVVVCVLGALVAVGRDSAITDALLAVTGSIVGGTLLITVAKKAPPGGGQKE